MSMQHHWVPPCWPSSVYFVPADESAKEEEEVEVEEVDAVVLPDDYLIEGIAKEVQNSWKLKVSAPPPHTHTNKE
jgi:hypothetical protein